nr:TPA_asm: acintoc5 [Pimephales minnow adintovirus]
MAEDNGTEPDHVCSCGISFGSILDDNAVDNILTIDTGPSDPHKDWRYKSGADYEPYNPTLSSDVATDPVAKPSFDATDGCFSDIGFKIIKAATVLILEHLIGVKRKDECEGCLIDHPSQMQHSCLFDPPNYYFDTHFDELSAKLFKPNFHSIIAIILNRCGLRSRAHRIQGTVGAILHELKDEPFILAKLDDIRGKLLDKACTEIVHDVVDLWEVLSIVNG